MKQCPYCGNWLEDRTAFCSDCGQPLEPPAPPDSPWSWPEDSPEPTRPMQLRRTAYVQAAPPAGADYQAVPALASAPGLRERWKDSDAAFRLLGGGLALVFLCVAALAALTLWTILSGGSSRPLIPLGGPAPTVTPWPTLTPWPTETPWPSPTPWADPTAVPTPELGATNQSGPQILSPVCAAALDHLKRASDTFNNSPTSVFDAAWREDMSQALAEMQAACGSLESASPIPGEVAEVQRLLALTSQTYEGANKLLKEGIDERSPAKVWQSVQQFNQAIKYLNEALKGLSKIGG